MPTKNKGTRSSQTSNADKRQKIMRDAGQRYLVFNRVESTKYQLVRRELSVQNVFQEMSYHY